MAIHIGRREFISLLGGVAVAWPRTARAQQGEQMRRIGVLIAGLTENDSEGQLRVAAFRRGLQNIGWIEGRMSTSRSAGQVGMPSACEASLPSSWGCGRMLFLPAMRQR
jgi:hypothetical protein